LTRRLLLLALVLLGAATAGASYNPTATCPDDGQTAYFSGERYTPNGDTCNYQHDYINPKTHRTEIHSYWVPCHN
jgi:hypothetical protein